MTAVEYLVEQVEQFIGLIPVDVIEKAKEMERQQKINFAEAFYDRLFQNAKNYHNYLESKQNK